MDTRQIIQAIDDGANRYVHFFGEANHMECYDDGYYCFVRPKTGEQGITFAYNIRLEDLAEKEQVSKIKEIRSLNMPIWWSLQLSDHLYKLIHGKEKMKMTSEPGDELYMAVLPDEQVLSGVLHDDLVVKKVISNTDFALWAKIANDVLSGGYPDIHTENHYPACKSGFLNCYLCYQEDVAAAVASIMNNDGICSLEFVATLPEYRRLGLAKAVCAKAMKDAFENGAKIITVRAINPGTKELYQSLGFKIYNDIL